MGVFDTLLGKVQNSVTQTAQRLFNTGQQFVSPIPTKTPKPVISEGALNLNPIQQAFYSSPLMQGAANIQKFIESPKPFAPLPTFQAQPNESIGKKIGVEGLNMASGIGNSIIGALINPALDIGRMGGTVLRGEQLPQYNTLKSGAAKVGYQAGALINPSQISSLGIKQKPKEVMAEIASTIEGPLNAYGGGKVFGMGSNLIKKPAVSLLGSIWNGMKSGGKLGGSFGLIQGLQSSKDIEDNLNYLLNVGGSTASGVGGGAILGGGVAGAGQLAGKFIGKIKGVIKNYSPHISEEQAFKEAVAFTRDELGRFAGLVGNNKEPIWASQANMTARQRALDNAKTRAIRRAIGLPEDGNYQRGFINLGAEVLGKKQMPQIPSNQLNQSSSNIIPPISDIDPIQKLIGVLQGAKPIRGEQEAIYRKIRSQKAGALAGIGKQMGGEAGFYKKLGQLKGEMPKVSFESIKKEFTQPELNSLFNKIEASPLSVFEKVNAQVGLKKLLGVEGGVIPNKSELALLNEVFPQELIQALLDKRPLVQKLFSLGESALNLPRAMMATADLSGPLRQGIFLIGRPKQWIPAFKDMFKYALNEKAYMGLNDQIRSRPTYQLMREAKLALTDTSPILQNREETFMSNFAEKIPGFGKLAQGSNRAYSGFLNKLRADTFDDLVKNAKNMGLDVDGKLLADIGNFVNTATGRGSLGALQGAATVLNGAFFSPRLMASRLNLLNPAYYIKLDPFVRKEALKSLLTFTSTAGTILGLAKLGGLDVGTDPRSADFAKIKTGDTRYDILGGFQQYLVLGTRLLTGEMVSSTTGKLMQLGEGYNTPTRPEIIANFLRSKESPVLSFLTSMAEGKDALGQKINIPSEVIDMFIPMLAQGIYDLSREEGLVKGTAMSIPTVFGVGSQTYTDPIPMEGKTATGKPNIQWRQQPSLGESILNKITGKQLSTVPQEQWKPLAEERKNEQLWKIKLDSIKKSVLTTGEAQVIQNPLTGANINVYLDNGVVKTKDLTPKVPKAKKTKAKISKVKAPKVTFKKTKKVSSKKTKLAKLKVKKAKKVKIAKIKTKISYKPLKIKKGA